MYDKTFFTDSLNFSVENPCIPGGYFVESPDLTVIFTRKGVFFTFRPRQSRRCGYFSRFFCGIFGLRTRTCPTHPVENWRPLAFSTGLWRACPHFRQGVSCRKRRIFRKNCEKIGDFGELHKLFNSCLCKTHFFHTVFHNLWKSRGEIHRGCVETVGNPWEKTEFSTGGGVTRRGDAHQLPLISLIISSSSVRKTGF